MPLLIIEESYGYKKFKMSNIKISVRKKLFFVVGKLFDRKSEIFGIQISRLEKKNNCIVTKNENAKC